MTDLLFKGCNQSGSPECNRNCEILLHNFAQFRADGLLNSKPVTVACPLEYQNPALVKFSEVIQIDPDDHIVTYRGHRYRVAWHRFPNSKDPSELDLHLIRIEKGKKTRCIDAYEIRPGFWSCPARDAKIKCPYAGGPGQEDPGEDIECPVTN